MGDKRQRARVQGSWAKSTQLPKGGARGRGEDSVPCQPRAGCWGTGPQTFEFHQPAKPLREVPVEKVIEHAGEYQISQGPTGVSRLRLVPGFLSQEEADWMFSKLLAELPWSQKTNFKQGRAYEEPRLTCWFGELPYTYSNSTLQPNSQWHPVLIQLREAVEQASGRSFNSLLCNLYRDGKDSIAWHSDSEASLGPEPVIASLSLGDTRCFSLRKQPTPEEDGDYTYVERLRIPLAHGTLLLMEGATQEDWQDGGDWHVLLTPALQKQPVRLIFMPRWSDKLLGSMHQVAKEYHDRGPRINLTFRTIYPEPARAKQTQSQGRWGGRQ